MNTYSIVSRFIVRQGPLISSWKRVLRCVTHWPPDKVLFCRGVTSSLFSTYIKPSTEKMSKGLVTKHFDSPNFRSVLTPELLQLKALFDKYGYEIRMAGGPVRDLVLGIKPSDIDLATVATPAQMKEMFTKEGIRMIHTNGEIHGTIMVRINDKENFEVTTLRIDLVTDGRRAQVDWTTDWEIDAQRRDLTVNAMFLGLDGTLYDYFNGLEDLANHRIRFVGSAAQRIQEDYLRILRYFRFYGRLALVADNHDADVLEFIRTHGDGLGKISGERIWSELRRILNGRFAGDMLADMFKCRLFPYIGLPEGEDEAYRVDRVLKLWRWSEENEKATHDKANLLHPVTLLTPLFHNPEEMMKFHARVKLSAFERDLGIFVILHRDDMVPKAEEALSVTERLRPYKELLLDAKFRQDEHRKWIMELMKVRDDLDLVHPFEEWGCPRLPVNGIDLKEAGVPGGKDFSRVFSLLREEWKASDCQMSREELIQRIPLVLDTLGLKAVPVSSIASTINESGSTRRKRKSSSPPLDHRKEHPPPEPLNKSEG